MQGLLTLLAACMIVLSVSAQQRTVTGKVTDNNGAPLAEVSVFEKKI